MSLFPKLVLRNWVVTVAYAYTSDNDHGCLIVDSPQLSDCLLGLITTENNIFKIENSRILDFVKSEIPE